MSIFKNFKINGEQVIYPKYTGLIFLTSVLFLVTGVSIAKVFENVFPKFEDKKGDKNLKKARLLVEVSIQIGAIAMITYIFREVITKLIKKVLGEKNVFGSPDKYAIIIVAPTMFSQQPTLIKKINYIWNK